MTFPIPHGRIVGALSALVLAGCAGTLATADRGAAAPLFGRAADLEGSLQTRRRQAPDDLRAAYLLALVRELHGKPAEALAAAIEALELSAHSDDPLAADLAEAAAYLIEDLDDVAPGYNARVLPVARRLVTAPGNIGPEATHVLSELLIRLGRRLDDDAVAKLGIERSGCIRSFLVAGPFGPWQLLGFDQDLPPERPGPVAGTYDLGPGRGSRAVREVQTRGCAANIGGEVPSGGTFFATAFIDVDRPRDVLVRVESPNALKLLINDQVAFTRDALRLPTGRIDLVPLRLPAGRSKLTLKLSSRHPNPVVVVSVLDARTFTPVGARGIEHPEAPYRPSLDASRTGPTEGSLDAMLAATREAGAPGASTNWEALAVFERLLAAVRALSRGDVVQAREAVRTLVHEAHAPPVAMAIAAIATMQDPALPEDVRRDRSRRLLRRTLEADPAIWIAPYQLARLEMAEDRIPRAIALLEEQERAHPGQVEFPLLLSDVYAGEGWEADALAAAHRSREANPDACRPLQALLSLRRRQNAVADVERLSRAIERCDHSSDAEGSVHLQARRWGDAERELHRLLAIQPDNVGLIGVLAEVQRGAGDFDASLESLARMLQLRPGSGEVVLRRSDLQLALGDPNRARDELTRALALRPGEMSELRRPLAALEGSSPMRAYRLDGAKAIRDFLASGHRYEAPAVLVLDYTVVRVWSDGSSLELTHNIIRVQSPEGIERYGEFEPPEGAELLAVRTIKADGTRLEPEEIVGKDSLSLPNLAPGDFVEFEYVVAREPPASFPGGFYGERFYFRSFDTPFDRTELHVVVPRAMELRIDERGDAPEVETTDEGPLRAYHFRRREMRPVVAEPHAVASREFLPSVQVSSAARWTSLVDGMRDALVDKERADPEIQRLALRISGPASSSPDEKALRLYRWVIREIEDGGDPFAEASEIILRRNGNRARALNALLRAAGIRSELALAMDVAADRTPTEVANADTYEHLLVRAQLPGGPRWISTFEEGAPFGYLPPSLRDQPAMGLVAGAPVWRTARGEEGGDRREVELELTIDGEGRGEASVVERCHGAAAVAWRRILRQIPTAELRQKFEQVYLGRVVEGGELLDLSVDGATDPQAPLILRYRWQAPAVARASGQRMVIRPLYVTLLSPDLARSPLRALPMVVDDVIDLRLEAKIDLPSGFELETSVPQVSVDGWFGRFHSRVSSREPGKATIERAIQLGPARIPADRYPVFANFCRTADQSQMTEVPLERGRGRQ